jgi:hypothetical protein
MRAPNPRREQTAAFYREFILPVEDQDPLSKPLSCGVHRWFKSANIRDLFRQRDDFLRIGSRLLGRGIECVAHKGDSVEDMAHSGGQAAHRAWCCRHCGHSASHCRRPALPRKDVRHRRCRWARHRPDDRRLERRQRSAADAHRDASERAIWFVPPGARQEGCHGD